MAAITICSDFGAQKIKSATVSTVSPSICYEVMGPDAMILDFWMLSFKPTFSLSSFTFIKRLFSSLLSAIGWCHLHIWGYWYFSQQSWFQLELNPARHFAWCTLHLNKWIGWQYTALTYSFPNLESVCFSMSGSNCCFMITKSIVLQELCLSDVTPWIYLSFPLYNHKGFNLEHTWIVQWFSLISSI